MASVQVGTLAVETQYNCTNCQSTYYRNNSSNICNCAFLSDSNVGHASPHIHYFCLSCGRRVVIQVK